MFDENSNSKPLSSLNIFVGPAYDNLAYDEDPTFIA